MLAEGDLVGEEFSVDRVLHDCGKSQREVQGMALERRGDLQAKTRR